MLKNLALKLLVLLILLLPGFVEAQGPQYNYRLNQIFTNPANSNSRVQELYAKGTVAASQTDSVLIAAVAGKKIRVLSIALVVAGTATTSTFGSKAGAGATTAISPAFSPAANGSLVLPFSPTGWMETLSGEGLVVTTGAGSASVYQIVYVTY